MSTEKQTIGSISERLNTLIQSHTGGNLKKFAEISGINPVTLLNYSKGRTPKADALTNICESFNVNINWLLTGRGERYIQDLGDSPRSLDPDPELSSMLSLARKVLTSGNPIAYDALERNIKYFAHAVDAEIELQQLKDDVKIIKEEFTKLKRENLRLDTEAEEQLLKKKVA
jgi:transcriptional regulator with XRE-family HTH domain